MHSYQCLLCEGKASGQATVLGLCSLCDDALVDVAISRGVDLKTPPPDPEFTVRESFTHFISGVSLFFWRGHWRVE